MSMEEKIFGKDMSLAWNESRQSRSELTNYHHHHHHHSILLYSTKNQWLQRLTNIGRTIEAPSEARSAGVPRGWVWGGAL